MSTTVPQIKVDFKGSVTAESASGETVSVSITNPDGTAGPVDTGQTQADDTYTTAGVNIPAAKGYMAVASVAADTEFGPATSAPLPFDALASRTITLNVDKEAPVTVAAAAEIQAAQEAAMAKNDTVNSTNMPKGPAPKTRA
jgi:hypothetical protein